jgi:RNA polymerase sigma-70 factor (ECF subfamily)
MTTTTSRRCTTNIKSSDRNSVSDASPKRLPFDASAKRRESDDRRDGVRVEHDDGRLVRRALAGDAAAFDALASRHRPSVLRAVSLLIGDADEAESLTQEALTRAYAGLSGFRPDLPFAAWLHGIALNLARNHLRDRARRARPTDPTHLRTAAAPEGRRQGVLSGILRQELNERTVWAIGQLPEAFREAFVLHYVEGLGYDAISRITGATAGALRVRARRAKLLLRDSLGPVVDTWLRSAGGEAVREE